MSLLVVLVLLLGALPPAAAMQKKHILFIVADDMSAVTPPYLHPSHPLANLPESLPFMPNLAAFAQDSLAFTRSYAQYPECNPSRASLFTSYLGSDLQLFTKSPLFKKKNRPTTLPEILKRNGYLALGFGKMFHQEASLYWSGPFKSFPNQGTVCSKDSSKKYCILPAHLLVDTFVWSNVVRTMKNALAQPKPFFLGVGFYRPHFQFSSDPDSRAETLPAVGGIYNQSLESKLAGFLERPNPATNGIPTFAAEMAKLQDTRPSTVANIRAFTFSSHQWVDKCLGNLIQAVKAAGIYNDTIIVVTADHGVMMLDHGSFGKSVLFEHARRVPLLIRHPDFTNSFGGKSNALVGLVDLMPTLLEFADIPVPGNIRGKSLVPVFQAMPKPFSPSAGIISEDARCATSGYFNVLKPNGQYGGQWIACEKLNANPPNRIDMYGISFRTPHWAYTEWRTLDVALLPTGQRLPDWSTSGLAGRELYNFTDDAGLVRVNTAFFEEQNLAPCDSCVAHKSGPPSVANGNPTAYRLGMDKPHLSYEPPALGSLPVDIQRVVRRLALALRAQHRDKDPICSGHGFASEVVVSGNQTVLVCDECVQGWTGPTCNLREE